MQPKIILRSKAYDFAKYTFEIRTRKPELSPSALCFDWAHQCTSARKDQDTVLTWISQHIRRLSLQQASQACGCLNELKMIFFLFCRQNLVLKCEPVITGLHVLQFIKRVPGTVNVFSNHDLNIFNYFTECNAVHSGGRFIRRTTAFDVKLTNQSSMAPILSCQEILASALSLISQNVPYFMMHTDFGRFIPFRWWLSCWRKDGEYVVVLEFRFFYLIYLFTSQITSYLRTITKTSNFYLKYA